MLNSLENYNFTQTEISQITGVAQERLNGWIKRKYVNIGESSRKGKGAKRLFSFRDVLKFVLLSKLFEFNIQPSDEVREMADNASDKALGKYLEDCKNIPKDDVNSELMICYYEADTGFFTYLEIDPNDNNPFAVLDGLEAVVLLTIRCSDLIRPVLAGLEGKDK